jgi:nucleoside-diphosphate-sugar epimerase
MNEVFEKNLVKTFAGKRVLITGGSGYIATSLVKFLKNVECHIIRLDRPDVIPPSIDGKAKIDNISCDIRNRDIWEKVLNKTDFIFHLAAQTSTYVANDNPLADIEINVLPLLTLLETCRKKQVRPILLFSSTVTVIGIPQKLPVDENHTGEPVTIYDLHKLIAEKYLIYYINQGYICGVILRLSNVYGPGPKSSRSDRGILNLMIRKSLAGERLTIYGSGEYLRDYLYVEDAARAFLMAAMNIERANGRHFIIGSGQGHTITEAINLVADRAAVKTGRRADVIHVEPESPQSPVESRNFVADSREFSNATGWKARVSLIEGIDRTIESC